MELSGTPVARGVAFIVGAMLTPRIVGSMRPPHLIAIGFVIAALGFGLLTQTGGTHDLPVVATAYAVFSLGLASVFTLASDLIVSTAPLERAGAAAHRKKPPRPVELCYPDPGAAPHPPATVDGRVRQTAGQQPPGRTSPSVPGDRCHPPHPPRRRIAFAERRLVAYGRDRH